MKLAIMQPYFLPYLGYWQLMHLVDEFVILDDVNFIKRGWVNRNRILLNGKEHLITLPLSHASIFKKINEHELLDIPEDLSRTVCLAYHKAPFFKEVNEVFLAIIHCPSKNLSRFLAHSINCIADYLGLQTRFLVASELEHDQSLKAQDMILDICQRRRASEYYNAIGGTALYSREKFAEHGIKLGFVNPILPIYPQFGQPFVPGLSILDVLMFNPPDKVACFLKSFQIV